MTNSGKVLRRPNFFVMAQIQRQLANEISWVICGIFVICIVESEAILSTSPITIATIIYECVSAFGNVGASLGYTGATASQCQYYHPLSKLVLIIMMYRGRHRGKSYKNKSLVSSIEKEEEKNQPSWTIVGLPAAIDRAILLPSEQLEHHEQEDHLLRRRNTAISIGGNANESPRFYNGPRT